MNLASSTLFWRINLTERRKCGRILVMNVEKTIVGVVASKAATDAAIKAFPELRSVEPIAQALTILVLLLLAAELLRRPAH